MQGHARESQGNIWEWEQCQFNVGGCRKMQGNARKKYGYVLSASRMLVDMAVGAKCQGNALKCRQANKQTWVQSARGMQGNTREMYVCKVIRDWRGMQGNNGKA